MAPTATRPSIGSPTASRSPRLPIGSKATIFGLALYGAAMVLLLLSALLSGDTAFIILFAVLLTVTLVIAGLVWRFGAWALALTALLMALSLVVNGPVMLEGFRFPASFFDFTPSLFSLPGNLIAIVGAIAALIARRRHAARTTPTRAERTATGALLAILVALAGLSGVLTLANRDSVSAEAKAGALPVRLKATKFEQERLEARADQPVRILVTNSDPGMHSFTIAALDTDVNINPASERLIEIGNVPPGEYAYVCRLFSHEQTMKGTLVVLP